MKNSAEILKNYIGEDRYIFNLFVSIIVVLSVFFWGVGEYIKTDDQKTVNSIISFRYFILLLIFPSIISAIYNIKNKNYSFILNFSLVAFFLILHLSINQFILGENIKLSTFYGIIFFLLIYGILYFYSYKIVQNLELIVLIFLIIFVISSLISLINYQPDAPYFCGGLKNYFNFQLGWPIDPAKGTREWNLSFKHILFKENSHIGMTAPAVILYCVYKITSTKTSKIFKVFTILFFIICLIKSSTTLIFGTISSILAISFFNFKNLTKKTLIGFTVIIIVFFTIAFTDRQCKTRFLPLKFFQYFADTSAITADLKKRIEAKSAKDYSQPKEYKEQGLDFNDPGPVKFPVIRISSYLCINCLQLIDPTAHSSTFQTFHRSLLITKYSLGLKPFGWGMNRYLDGFDAFRYKNEIKYYRQYYKIETLNRHDGVNNFNKLIVEFGYLSIFIFIFILLYMNNKKINLEEKLFFLPIIITQMIRGAGYFNGGFALILIIMFLTYLNKIKENKSIK